MNNEITIYTNEYIDCLVKQLEHFSEMMLYAFIAMPCICLCFLPQNFIKLDTVHTAVGTVICFFACLMLAFQTFLWAKQKAVNKDRLRIISDKNGKKSRITSLLMKVERRMWIILFSVSLSLYGIAVIFVSLFVLGMQQGNPKTTWAVMTVTFVMVIILLKTFLKKQLYLWWKKSIEEIQPDSVQE